MRRDLMDILACPVCKGPLSLAVEQEVGDDIVKGSLTCSQCKETYPIEDGIPNLLPPSLRTA
ncbi:MAG: methytransferase partner Trm112 [Dehalococcoidia bacterium]